MVWPKIIKIISFNKWKEKKEKKHFSNGMQLGQVFLY